MVVTEIKAFPILRFCVFSLHLLYLSCCSEKSILKVCK